MVNTSDVADLNVKCKNPSVEFVFFTVMNKQKNVILTIRIFLQNVLRANKKIMPIVLIGTLA